MASRIFRAPTTSELIRAKATTYSLWDCGELDAGVEAAPRARGLNASSGQFQAFSHPTLSGRRLRHWVPVCVSPKSRGTTPRVDLGISYIWL